MAWYGFSMLLNHVVQRRDDLATVVAELEPWFHWVDAGIRDDAVYVMPEGDRGEYVHHGRGPEGNELERDGG